MRRIISQIDTGLWRAMKKHQNLAMTRMGCSPKAIKTIA
jgi:hypothetical protein